MNVNMELILGSFISRFSNSFANIFSECVIAAVTYTGKKIMKKKKYEKKKIQQNYVSNVVYLLH